jgi:thiamine biosynthesis protein ThiS
MQCTINGKPAAIAPGTSLTDYFTAAGLSEAGLVVERNGVIIDAGDFSSTVLCPGDQVEIVSFVAGG